MNREEARTMLRTIMTEERHTALETDYAAIMDAVQAVVDRIDALFPGRRLAFAGEEHDMLTWEQRMIRGWLERMRHETRYTLMGVYGYTESDWRVARFKVLAAFARVDDRLALVQAPALERIVTNGPAREE